MRNGISQVRNRLTYVIVLGIKIRSLGFYHDQFKKFLETPEGKPELMVNTEFWLTDTDPLDRYDLDEY